MWSEVFVYFIFSKFIQRTRLNNLAGRVWLAGLIFNTPVQSYYYTQLKLKLIFLYNMRHENLNLLISVNSLDR